MWRTSASASPVGVTPFSLLKAASSNETVSRVKRTLASSPLLPAAGGPSVAGGLGLTGGEGGGSPLARAAAAAAAAAARAASKRATSSGGASGGGWLSRGSAAHLVRVRISAGTGLGLGLGLGLGVAEQGQRSARVLPPRQLSPYVGELARWRALHPQHRPVGQGQLHRGAVQPQPLQPALPPVPVDLGVAVSRVADDGVGESIEVLADLVPPSEGEGEGEGEG